MNKLEQLRAMTVVVADTGEINAIRNYRPVDATTNPSLVLKTLQHPDYQHLLDQALSAPSLHHASPSEVALELAVQIGRDILSIIPGMVSTEVDARLSFDTAATLQQARRIADRYARHGITRDRILIKIAATWEGITAARQLESEGIRTNLTLIFNVTQALACAEAGATLISPFVGRIMDWHKAHGSLPQDPLQDPGVASVRDIYTCFKARGHATIVMGASFRTAAQIEALSGCDRLTISPALLATLEADTTPLTRALPEHVAPAPTHTVIDERAFRWAFNQDAMATEKLAEGIRLFAQDQNTLESMITAKRQAR